MSVFIYDKGLSYYPAPKCACTSLKKAMFRIQNGFDFRNFKINERRQFIHSLYATMKFERSSAMDREGHFRFVVVRDPVRRFLSCYSNRVLYHKELSEKKLGDAALADGLRPNPTLSEFVDNLDLYRKHSWSITHHSEPQVFFFGSDPQYFSRIYDIRELDELCSDLSKLTGEPVAIGREQTGGPKIDIDSLSSAEIAKVRSFYHKDYDTFGDRFESI